MRYRLLVNGLFPRFGWTPTGQGIEQWAWVTLGGCAMPRRLLSFLRGDADAVPGDYVLALVAVVGMILALSVNAFF